MTSGLIWGALVIAAGLSGVELGPGVFREVRWSSGSPFWKLGFKTQISQSVILQRDPAVEADKTTRGLVLAVQPARGLRNTKNLVRPSDFLIVDDARVSTFLIYRLDGRPDGHQDGRQDGGRRGVTK